MQELATTSVQILRGETANEFRQTDSTTAAYASIPASIVETGQRPPIPTQQPRTVRTITAVMPQWADVLNTDRLQDACGTVYAVIEVTAQPSLGYPADKVLKLRRVTAAGV